VVFMLFILLYDPLQNSTVIFHHHSTILYSRASIINTNHIYLLCLCR
jgi:hypothetical protein